MHPGFGENQCKRIHVSGIRKAQARIRDEHEASAAPTRIRRGREGRPRWHQELDGLQEPEREGVPAPAAVLTRQTEAASGLSSTASRLGLTVGLCWHFFITGS